MLPRLTKKEKEVFEFIKNFINTNNIPPTNREIAEYFNIAPKNAFKYLSILEKKGYIKKEKKISRGISLSQLNRESNTTGKKIPFISYVAAGTPIEIDNYTDDYMIIDEKLFPYSNIFMFKVIGDSMINAHIKEGDIAIVSPDSEILHNDIVVVSIFNEITLKRYIKKGDLLILHAENPAYKDIVLNSINPDEIKIIGKVVGIIRKI